MGLKQAEETLATAASLLGKLAGEKTSWVAQAEAGRASLRRLPACAALAAAFVTYAASESEAARGGLMREWRAIEGLDAPEDFSVPAFLSSEREQLAWKGQGLPGDQVRTACGLSLTLSHCVAF